MTTLITPVVEKEEVAVETVETVETGEPEVETVTAIEPEVATNTVVAVQEAKTPAVQTAGGGSLMDVYSENEAAGFSGLEVDAFSFDRVKLQDGEFLMGEATELGKSFNFKALATRPIYVVRQSNDQDAEVYYSYDPAGLTLIDGQSAEETLEKWKEDGYGVEGNPLDIKRYMEVMAEIVDGNHDGDIVSLSVPPASYKKFSGLSVIAKMKHNCTLDGVIIEASVGATVKGAGDKPFRPWQFKIARLA